MYMHHISEYLLFTEYGIYYAIVHDQTGIIIFVILLPFAHVLDGVDHFMDVQVLLGPILDISSLVCTHSIKLYSLKNITREQRLACSSQICNGTPCFAHSL